MNYYNLRQHNLANMKIVHNKREPYDILIDRTSKWGNPFNTKDYPREQAIFLYQKYLLGSTLLLKDLHELKGKTLGCWCAPKHCHGDILIKVCHELQYRKNNNLPTNISELRKAIPTDIQSL